MKSDFLFSLHFIQTPYGNGLKCNTNQIFTDASHSQIRFKIVFCIILNVTQQLMEMPEVFTVLSIQTKPKLAVTMARNIAIYNSLLCC